MNFATQTPSHTTRVRAYSTGVQQRRSIVFSSPQRAVDESQILNEFNRLLINQEQEVQQDLDDQIAVQALRHEHALAEAAAEHDRIRKNAEIARERAELEIERERKRRDALERQRLEDERQAKVTRDTAERLLEKKTIERERREQAVKLEEEQKLEETRAGLERDRIKAVEDAAKRKMANEEAIKMKARESAANAARLREEAAQNAAKSNATSFNVAAKATPIPSQTVAGIINTVKPTAGILTTKLPAGPLQGEFEQLHVRYLELHRTLKSMRQYVITESKKDPALKNKLGDWRREIVKSIGQITADKTKNRKPLAQVQAILLESLKYKTPVVDIAQYLISQENPSSGQQVVMPGVFIYLLNIFAKAVISQFIYEASTGVTLADPVGVITVTMFATPAFKIQNVIPLIDILIAKFHVSCPLLFAISGSQNTAVGRLRLGWRKDDDSFIPEQRHLERMAGLAKGWASLTLRDFSKSKNENPIPNYYYWRSIACVTNCPISEFSSTHATVLKSLIDGFVGKFIGFYGTAAKAALRFALVDLPDRIKNEASTDQRAVQAAAGLQVLREVLQKDLKMSFD